MIPVWYLFRAGGGVSHNPSEHAELSSICDGARVMYEYLKGETAK